MAARIIDTGIPATDKKSKEILDSVIGQLSDGIWENSPGMAKYWQNLDVSIKDGDIVITESTYSPFWKYSPAERDKKVLEFFANKIKQIIKTEIEDGNENLEWNRDCTGVSDYLGYKEQITVRDAYKVYDKLKGRKDRIKESKKLKENKIGNYTVEKVADGFAVKDAQGNVICTAKTKDIAEKCAVAILGTKLPKSFKTEGKELKEANDTKELQFKVYMDFINYLGEVNESYLIAAFRSYKYARDFVKSIEDRTDDITRIRVVG